MFKKILIANRGEIAVRIMRTCRSMGIETVALYHQSDLNSLHVWLADEIAQLEASTGFNDQQVVLGIAKKLGADAIHPGYGFLAERDDFAQRCWEESIAFIGPPVEVLASVRRKIDVLRRAHAAGFPVPQHSEGAFGPSELPLLRAEAERLGYPLLIKSSRGGRGRGAHLVWSSERLERALQRAYAEAIVFYGERRVYLEKAIIPAHQIGVQVIGDGHGNLVHLGEREGSLLYGNQKIIEETPAPCLSSDTRSRLIDTAMDLARMFDYQNIGTLEFLVDEDGQFYFSEFKPRIQIEHPITEMCAGVDLVRAQIQIANGRPFDLAQEDICLKGWSMQCRVSASDPWQRYLPSPGHISQLRLPGGPDTRVDTYIYAGCDIPSEYDPLIAKLIVAGPDRRSCLLRLCNALQELRLVGVSTNLPLIQGILEQPEFEQGEYSTQLLPSLVGEGGRDETLLRDLAVAAALEYLRRNQFIRPASPERLSRGWHRSARRLPE